MPVFPLVQFIRQDAYSLLKEMTILPFLSLEIGWFSIIWGYKTFRFFRCCFLFASIKGSSIGFFWTKHMESGGGIGLLVCVCAVLCYSTRLLWYFEDSEEFCLDVSLGVRIWLNSESSTLSKLIFNIFIQQNS